MEPGYGIKIVQVCENALSLFLPYNYYISHFEEYIKHGLDFYIAWLSEIFKELGVPSIHTMSNSTVLKEDYFQIDAQCINPATSISVIRHYTAKLSMRCLKSQNGKYQNAEGNGRSQNHWK